MATISYNFKSKLIFYNTESGGKNLKIDTCVNDILTYVQEVKQTLDDQGETLTFQEGNDAVHGRRSYENSARYFKVEMDLECLEDWPARSPDLSPIENIWRTLKQRVKSHSCKTSQELEWVFRHE